MFVHPLKSEQNAKLVHIGLGEIAFLRGDKDDKQRARGQMRTLLWRVCDS